MLENIKHIDQILRQLVCPKCGSSNIDAAFFVKGREFHIVCHECSHDAVSINFDLAATLFELKKEAANG